MAENKRADQLTPGDIVEAWGPDYLVTRVRPPRGGRSPLTIVTYEAADGATFATEYGPGAIVEVKDHVELQVEKSAGDGTVAAVDTSVAEVPDDTAEQPDDTAEQPGDAEGGPAEQSGD